MEFCKAFNAQTQKLEKGSPIPVVITIYADRSFTFEMRTPPVSFFLKKAAKLEKGAKTPGRDKVGEVTKEQVKEIATQKMKDSTATPSNPPCGWSKAPPVRWASRRGVDMAQHGKRTVKAREGIDREKLYPLDEAVKLIQERAKAKFDETIEIAMNLGVDPRHADQTVRGVSRCPTAPAAPSGSRCSPAAPRPTRPAPPVPTWSAPKIWWSTSLPATLISTAASRRLT